MQRSEFEEYVHERLELWGSFFSTDRCAPEPAETNVIYRLMHPKARGFDHTREAAQRFASEIEGIVAVIATSESGAKRVTALRARFCTHGRAGIERFETAKKAMPGLTRSKFFAMVDVATAEVGAVLRDRARGKSFDLLAVQTAMG
jgi:hypothetical protein